MSVLYIDKQNKRVIGFELAIFNEQHVVGTTGIFTSTPDFIRLIEVPLQESPSTVAIPGFSEVTTTPGTNEFRVDYTSGRIEFHSSKNSTTVFVTYKGKGSIIDAEDVNELQTPVGVALNSDGEITTGHVKPVSISTNIAHDFTFPNDLTVNGNLDVKGTLTSLQTETVTIDDNKILLNSNVTGAPTEDSGIEIERGSSPNVELIWEETVDGWQMKDSSGSAILTALDTGLVGIGTDDPKAKFHNIGSTLFGVDSATDPGSISTAQVDDFTGVIVDTTGAVSLTVPSPTNTLEGRFFTVVHKDGSSGTLLVDGKPVNVGQGVTLMWSGTGWAVIGGSGKLALIVGDLGSPSQGDVWLDTTTKNIKVYNGTSIVILG